MLAGLVPANAWATDEATATTSTDTIESTVTPEKNNDAGDDATPDATTPDATSDEAVSENEGVAPEDAANDGTAVVAAAAVARTLADDTQPAADAGIVYIDGVKGDDANDGTTTTTAVKTFERAKELLGTDGTEIRVLAPITVKDTQEWSLAEGQKVVRDASFTAGSLVKVNNGSLTLSDITIDGGFGTTNQGVTNDAATGSLIFASGGSINLNAGSKLQNNHVITAKDGSLRGSIGGGAIGATSATKITIDGGTIDNCTHFWNGGAIDLRGSQTEEGKVTFRSGTISNCSAGLSGGAINLNSWGAGDSMVMSGGTITNCSAGSNDFAWRNEKGEYPGYGGDGGAICAGYASLQITGDTFTNNTTAYRGGAICLRERSGGLIKATGDDIVIDGNTSLLRNSDDLGASEAPAVVGGGGIYVDEGCKLRLDYALVTGNSAAVDGGGVAFCPTASVDIKLAKEVATFDNDTDTGVAKDLVVITNGVTTSDGFAWDLKDATLGSAYVSPTMLGGGAYNWIGADGNVLPLDQLDQTDGFFGTAAPSQAGKDAATNAASVLITNNSAASFGGGIACNGTLTSYETVDTTMVSLTVKKEWVGDSTDSRPESIRVNVLQDGEKIGFVDVKPADDGTWTVTVNDLPKADKTGAHVFTYTLEEEKVTVGDGEYAATYGEPATDDDGNVTASITNTKQLATKFSKQDVSGNELAGAKMQVLDADGNVIDEWTSDGTRHEVLLGSGEYKLHEVIAPDGYEVATDIEFVVDTEAGTVTVKGSSVAAPENTVVMVDNAKTVPTPDKPETPGGGGEKPGKVVSTVTPKTGDATSMALPIALGVAGIAVVGFALAKRRKDQ